MRKYLCGLIFLFSISCATMNIYDPITKVVININSGAELEKMFLKILEGTPAILEAVKGR